MSNIYTAQPSFVTLYPNQEHNDTAQSQLSRQFNKFRANRFTVRPMQRQRRRRRQLHPHQYGRCYLHLIHPKYWDLAYKELKKNPYAIQVKAFIKQLIEQSADEEQLELLLYPRLDLQVRGFDCHVVTNLVSDTAHMTPLDILSIVPNDNIIGKETNNEDAPIHKISWWLLSVLLASIYLRYLQTKKKFFWRNNVAITALIPLTARFVVTGHMFTTVDPEEKQLEPVWFFCKIVFLLMVIPRPSGFRWIVPSVLFWNHVLGLFALANGYMYFCSMLDANLPFSRLSPEQIYSTSTQKEEWSQSVNAWKLLIQVVKDTYAK